MCRCHASPGALSPRRQFLKRTLVSVTLPVLAACDPAGVGELFVSGDQIDELGAETWQRIKAETPRSRDDNARRRVVEMTRRILAAAGERPEAWEVELFAPDQINAFAVPGNKIGVYEGMVTFASDDAELAAVIGHEIGHNQAEHARQRIARELGTRAGLQLVSAALQVGDIGYADQIAGLLGAGAQFGVLLPFTREQELEADQLGLTNMARGGYDPRAAIGLWERMGELARSPEMLSTHPAPDSRIAALEAMMPEALALYSSG